MGQLLGILSNVALQFIVIRYLFVYHSLNGYKSKYEEKKVGYNFLFVLISLFIYPILYVIGTFFIPFVVVFMVVLIYYAFIMHDKWKKNNILPNPFLSKRREKNEEKSRINKTPLKQNDFINQEEKLFFEILKNYGVRYAISTYNKFKEDKPNQQLFQRKKLNQYGYKLFKMGNFEDAKKIFELNLLAYPRSSNCHASLADVLLINKQYDLAKKHYEYALNYLITDIELTDEFKEKLMKDIKTKLAEIHAALNT